MSDLQAKAGCGRNANARFDPGVACGITVPTAIGGTSTSAPRILRVTARQSTQSRSEGSHRPDFFRKSVGRQGACQKEYRELEGAFFEPRQVRRCFNRRLKTRLMGHQGSVRLPGWRTDCANFPQAGQKHRAESLRAGPWVSLGLFDDSCAKTFESKL